MPLLLVCFVLFFGLAELLPAVDGMTVPTPVIWVGGLLLAIASNYYKPAGLPWRVAPRVKPAPLTVEPVAAAASVPTAAPEPTPSALSDFDLRPRSSISFVIRQAKPQKPTPRG